MKPYYQDDLCTLYHADCREPARQKATAVVTDPPYGLGFMGRAWDHAVPGIEFWQAIIGASLPGAPLLAFGGTRLYHRLTCAIEDAGWEIRDCLMWIYGSGFPKSHNISKSIDKMAGAEPIDLGISPNWRESKRDREKNGGKGSQCWSATDAAQVWKGQGTALKPAYEPIVLAMKPLDGTYAANAQEHGIAGMNIDGTRISGDAGTGIWGSSNEKCQDGRMFNCSPCGRRYQSEQHPQGRWPANIIHDGSQLVLNLFPESKSGAMCNRTERAPQDEPGSVCYGRYGGNITTENRHASSGSAARFFYCAKASKSERNKGCGDLADGVLARSHAASSEAKRGNTVDQEGGAFNKARVMKNDVPTVKPLALMRYLITLVIMPERNLILDPFAGSGTTGVACKELGIPCVLVEKDEHSCEIAAARLIHHKQRE